MTIVMVLYMLVLLALAWYLLAHQHQGFLTLKEVPAKTGKQLRTYAYVLILAALVALLGTVLANTQVQLGALVLGAAAVGILGINLPKLITNQA
ncbi:hypothetical protein [Lacticaseibacillus jixiensis]|uniref:hypothetical protein n=1 Tax=Lacticaseibacillus jixiensis TaxID=3231926 RepID=UPI0036F35F41